MVDLQTESAEQPPPPPFKRDHPQLQLLRWGCPVLFVALLGFVIFVAAHFKPPTARLQPLPTPKPDGWAGSSSALSNVRMNWDVAGIWAVIGAAVLAAVWANDNPPRAKALWVRVSMRARWLNFYLHQGVRLLQPAAKVAAAEAPPVVLSTSLSAATGARREVRRAAAELRRRRRPAAAHVVGVDDGGGVGIRNEERVECASDAKPEDADAVGSDDAALEGGGDTRLDYYNVEAAAVSPMPASVGGAPMGGLNQLGSGVWPRGGDDRAAADAAGAGAQNAAAAGAELEAGAAPSSTALSDAATTALSDAPSTAEEERDDLAVAAARSRVAFSVQAQQERVHVLRLRPGADLLGELRCYVSRADLRAAYIVTCVGSLSLATLRFAGRREAATRAGPFEICSLVGTLGAGAAPHLHVSLFDGEGAALGGHVLEGCTVHTTAEIVLGECAQLAFTRPADAETTYDELLATRLAP